ncbi:hypothetical protein LINGRAPRIM_LOCUS3291, partial [Linum grandiflorum]
DLNVNATQEEGDFLSGGDDPEEENPDTESESACSKEEDMETRIMEVQNSNSLKTADSEVEALSLISKSVNEVFGERAQKPKKSKISREMQRLNWEAAIEKSIKSRGCFNQSVY